eukprot:TRINITY_DN662_c0_g1_i1.p1 TRINITY_DN662_c0_g1~~TRINITY_DN662_c0_g1_i1.p1  ORF type:complete len:132 (-),score=24.54 TRINITY_DN662_c0_g1_i1:46-441(-)
MALRLQISRIPRSLYITRTMSSKVDPALVELAKKSPIKQAENKFVFKLDGRADLTDEAILEYNLDSKANTIDLYHTFVPGSFRGLGIAERLCDAAFDYAKEKDLKVIPTCSYVSETYLKRKPEKQPQVSKL